MVAYLLVDFQVTDPEGFRAYGQAAGRFIAQHGGVYRAAMGKPEVLEGHPRPGVRQRRQGLVSPQPSASGDAGPGVPGRSGPKCASTSETTASSGCVPSTTTTASPSASARARKCSASRTSRP